jgi:membrane protein required for colicin V production
MNYLDIVIVVIVAWSLFRGYKNGLFIEIASVAALILGIWGSIRFSGFTETKLVEYFDLQTQHLGLIAFIVTFIIIVVLVHFLANALDKLLKAVALGFVVRILGMIFAVLKAVLIMSIVLVVLSSIDRNSKLITSEQKQESVLYNTVADFAPMLFPIIEGGDLRKGFDNLRNRRGEKAKREEPGVIV